MAKARGLNFKVFREFALQNYGESGYDKLLAAVDPETREMFQAKFATWTEDKVITKMIRVLAQVFNCSEDEMGYKLGYHAAAADIGPVYRFVLALASPEKIISRFPEIWKSKVSSGAVTKVDIDGKKCTMIVEGFEAAGLDCYVTMGTVTRILEMASAKNVKVLHPECAGKGGKFCRFEFSWE